MEAVVGEHVWNVADFETTPGVMRVGGNRKGVVTRSRDPKLPLTCYGGAGAARRCQSRRPVGI